jgi:hypothetical protein
MAFYPTSEVSKQEVLNYAKENLTIKDAKEILEKHGFFVDNLWHISDVNEFYICDDDTAQSILSKSLNNHDSVFEAIDYFANELNLERK